MCHFLTATLPSVVDPELVARIFLSHNLGFELISNPYVAQQTEPKDWYVLTTRKHCDCGTALGSLSRRDHRKEVSYERVLKKFRKQGWSETKIQRWLEQKQQTTERHRREDDAEVQAGNSETDEWMAFLSELLRSGLVPRIGLLLHWYHRSIQSEGIDIQDREQLRLAELSAERLMKMQEDVLYEVVA